MDHPASPHHRDDRVLGTTRALAVVIVPFLLAAFVLLFGFTDRTGELFAWRIDAPMTAMTLGSAYLGGAWYFARTAVATRWHHVAVGFLPVTAFATFMGVATLLHLDRFNHGHVSFITWLVLYLTTPALVLAAWLRNRRRDDGMLEAGDLRFPRPLRLAIGAGGAAYVLAALALLTDPSGVAAWWPWALTPLTGRVVGGILVLLGVFGLTIAADGRWSSCRLPLQSLVVAMAGGLVSVVRAWDTIDPTRPFTWIYLGTLALLLAVVPLGTAWVDRRLGAIAPAVA